MKIKRLSFLLALVLILSAFAGTFTISAEGEDAAANAWEVASKTYATFQEAIDAALPGDTIYLIADYTQTGDVDIKKDLTIEGRTKADGTSPVFTHAPSWDVISIGDMDDPEAACTVVFKNFDYNTVNLKQSGSIYVRRDCSFTMENMNIVYGVGVQAHFCTKGLVRLYGGNNDLTFRNCTIKALDKMDTPIRPGLVGIDKAEGVENTVMIDECDIDFSMAVAPVYVFQCSDETAAQNTLILRNSTFKTPDSVDFPFAQGEPYQGSASGTQFRNQTLFGGTLDYRGTNTVNGVTTTNADIDYLIYDNQAREQGFTVRVGDVKDAIILKDDGTAELIGYYKDIVEACNKALPAAEGEKQKTVYLINDVTVDGILELPTATIDGQNRTLTAYRIYKKVDAILEVTSLNIVTTTENPIFQMNGDSEDATAPSYAKFTKCTFTTDQKVPYAYFVQQANLTLDRCTINITNADCDKPIFRLDKGADLTLQGSTVDVAASAPKLIGFDVVNDGGSIITLKSNTKVALGETVFTSSSKSNTTLVVNERASLSTANTDAIVVPAEATGWVLTIGGTAEITSAKGVAITVNAPNMAVTVGGNAKVVATEAVLHAAAEGVVFTVESGATLEMLSHAKSNATVLLEGEGSKLVSEGTITALKTTATVFSIELAGANTSALIKGGTINNAVSVGTADAAAAFVMTGGKIVAQERAASAVVLTNGSADILSGTLSGGAAAISGQKEVVYAEGTTEITLNELYTYSPVTVGTSMRMNEGSLGMRFTSSAEAAAVAYAEALKACGAITNYEFGTLIVRATEIRQREMTVEALSAENITHAVVTAKDGIVAAEDGSITYTAAVINFTEDNMGTSLVARAYLKYTLIDGSALYVYAEDHTEGISIGELAQQCLADVVDESAEGYRNQVQEFYEADEDGWYELIEETAYSPYSKEQQAALKQIVENADL